MTTWATAMAVLTMDNGKQWFGRRRTTWATTMAGSKADNGVADMTTTAGLTMDDGVVHTTARI